MYLRKCTEEEAERLVKEGTDFLVEKKTTTYKIEILNPSVDANKPQSFE